MSPTRLTGVVHVFRDSEVVTLNPGDILPDWAVEKVTNPDVLEEFDADAPPAQPSEPDRSAPADNPPNSQTPGDITNLRAEAKELGVDARGNEKTLRARIAEKRAELAEAAAAEAETTSEDPDKGENAGDGDTPENTPSTLDALRAKAKGLGLEVTDETTEAELEAFIASKE